MTNKFENIVTNPLNQRRITSEVDESGNEVRVDIWLTGRFTYRSRQQWQELIKEKKILINNSPCRASAKLQTGNIVTFIPDTEEPEVDRNYNIIFEDDYFLGIDKPGQLPCHPAGAYYKNTLWYLLIQQYQNIHFINRIDRETSGVVLIGKDGKTAGRCSSSIMLKKYTVIVYGEFPDELLTEGYLYENRKITPQDREKVRKKRYFSESEPDCKSENAKTLFRKLSFNPY